jgi:hypothetical protein
MQGEVERRAVLIRVHGFGGGDLGVVPSGGELRLLVGEGSVILPASDLVERGDLANVGGVVGVEGRGAGRLDHRPSGDDAAPDHVLGRALGLDCQTLNDSCPPVAVMGSTTSGVSFFTLLTLVLTG